MRRATGGNRLIAEDAGIPELMRVIHKTIYELKDWADDDEDLELDVSKISVETKRIPSGLISVEVSADMKKE